MPPARRTMPTEEELLERRQQIAAGRPPSHELPGVFALELLLVRNETVAIGVPYVLVYSSGWVLAVTAAAATRSEDQFGLTMGGFMHPLLKTKFRTPLLLGVEYVDGRRGSTVHEAVRPTQGQFDPGTGRIMMQSLPGGGHEMSALAVTMSWFVRPVPDDGDVTLVAAWPKHHLEEIQVVISGEELRAARGRVTTLWPEPANPMDYPSAHTPPPVQLPATGWFAVTPAAADADERSSL